MPKKRKTKHKLKPFIALERELLRSDAWQIGLTPAEKIVYIHLKYKFVGHNNGEISLHYSELRKMFSPATISRAFKGLEAKEWIERTRRGGLFRFSSYFRLTAKFDKAIVNYSF